MKIEIEIDDRDFALLEVLTRSAYSGVSGELSPADRVKVVIETLIDHAQQGVYRPGSWERPWLMQLFGDDWLQFLELDSDQVIPGSIGGIGRKDMPFDRPRRMS